MDGVEQVKTKFLNDREDASYNEAFESFFGDQVKDLQESASPVEMAPDRTQGNVANSEGYEELAAGQEGLPEGAPDPQAAQEDPSILAELPRQVVGGARDAVQEGLDAFNELSEYMQKKIPLGSIEFGGEGGAVDFVGATETSRRDLMNEVSDPFESQLPQVEKPATVAGGLTRGISQFMTGFFPALKAVKYGNAATKASKVRRAVAAGAITDFTVFDPHEERLSDLVQEYPYLRNPVNEYLSANPYDGSVEGRLKNVLEGFGVDMAIGGAFMAGLKVYRSARHTKKAPVEEIDSISMESAAEDAAKAGQLDKPPSAMTMEEFKVAKDIEGSPIPADADYGDLLVDSLATGKPIAKQTTDSAEYKQLVEGLRDPLAADEVTKNTLLKHGLAEQGVEEAPEGMQAFLKLAKETETADDFLKRVDEIKGVDPETSEWFRGRYGVFGTPEDGAKQFMEEVKSGNFMDKETAEIIADNIPEGGSPVPAMDATVYRNGDEYIVENGFDRQRTTMNRDEFVSEVGKAYKPSLKMTEKGEAVRSAAASPIIYNDPIKVKLEPPTDPKKILGDPDRSLTQRVAPTESRNVSEAGGADSTSAMSSSGAGAQSVPVQATTSAPPSSVFAKPTARPSNLETGRVGTSNVIESPPTTGVYHKSNDFVKLFDTAKRVQPEFEDHLRWLTSDLPGAKFIGSRLKDMEKAKLKLDKKGIDPARMSDYLGARLSVQTKDEFDKLIAKMNEHSTVIEIEDFTQAPKAGYRAVHVQVQTKGGFSAEVQVLPEPIARVQDQAHALYEKFRRRPTRMTADELAEVEAARAESESIFEGAWKEWTANNSPVTDEVTQGMIRIDAPAGNRAMNINLARIQGSQDIKDVIAEASEFYRADIDDARRGVQTNKATAELADQLGMNVDTLLSRQAGQAFNAEQAVASRNLLVASADKLSEMATNIRNGEAAPDDLFAFRKMIETHRAIQMEVSGMTAEAGRALQSFNIQAKSRRQQLRAIDEILERSGGLDIQRGIAKSIADLTEEGASNAKISQAATEFARVTSLDTLLTIRQAALLSSYKTHIVNIVSNAITMTSAIPERFIAGGIAALRGSDSIKSREGLEMMNGMVSGVWDSINIAARSFRDNVEFDFTTKIPEARQNTVSVANLSNNRLGKGVSGVSRLAGGKALGEGGFVDHLVNGLGMVVDLPFRALGAEDAFFKSMNAQMELHALAYRKAGSEGLKGNALRDRVVQILSNPPEEITEQALNYARVQTFTNPNRTASAISSALSKVKIARFIVPFIRTPTNLIKYSLDRTPVAFLFEDVRADIAAGGSRRALAEARIAMGSTMMIGAGTLASSGAITGAPPKDPKLRQIWLTENQPYSINVNHGTGKPAKWKSYNRLDPFGSVLGMGADMWQISAVSDDSNIAEMATMAVMSISNQVLNKTWMTGLSDFMEAINDPQRRGERYLDYMMASFVPALSRQLNYDLSDPVVRDFDTTWQGMMSRVPGYSDTLPARRDIWGGMRMYSGGAIMQTKDAQEDPVNEFLIRRQISVSMPQRAMSVGGVRVKLLAEEYSRFVELAREPAKQELDLLLPQLEAIEGIGSGSPLDDQVRSVLRSHAARARVSLMNEYPEIRDRAVLQREEQIDR